jgi:hypothetical protein
MSGNPRVRRRRPFRDPLPRILIVCEGTQTEPVYFGALRHHEKSLIDLKVEPGGVPKTLVEKAAALKRVADKSAKRQKDPNLRYDHVWCVFDIDEHPNVGEAAQQARDNGIQLAISNPCFELWILLHFQDQRAYIERAALHRECVNYLPGYEKRVPFDKIHGYYSDAVRRAIGLRDWQRSRGCEYQTNPWTDVQNLTELIMSFRRVEVPGTTTRARGA